MGFLGVAPKMKQPTTAPVEPTIHKDEEAEARLKAGQEAKKEKKRLMRHGWPIFGNGWAP